MSSTKKSTKWFRLNSQPELVKVKCWVTIQTCKTIPNFFNENTVYSILIYTEMLNRLIDNEINDCRFGKTT